MFGDLARTSKGIDVVQVNIAIDGGQQINVAGNIGHNEEAHPLT